MPLSLMLAILLSASTAFLAAVALRSLALRRGWVSRAVAQRAGPGGIPVAGGLAILLAMAAGCLGSALLGAVPCGGGAHLAGIGVLLAGFALVGLGDDCRSLSPWGRLAAEALLAATAAALLSAGMPAGAGDPAGASGGRAGWGHPVFLAAAMVAGANAFNLVDNSDGLAAGMGALSFAGLAWMGVEPLLFGSAAAALAGFWLLNRPPARLYLGDHGTLPLGGLLGLGLAALAGAPGGQEGGAGLPVPPSRPVISWGIRSTPWRGACGLAGAPGSEGSITWPTTSPALRAPGLPSSLFSSCCSCSLPPLPSAWSAAPCLRRRAAPWCFSGPDCSWAMPGLRSASALTLETPCDSLATPKDTWDWGPKV
jgi:UDP-N-acetylmuramyl pentapeptide phosphotransferase/UDP-N-acetylglucosamine-1-phosphate transferase